MNNITKQFEKMGASVRVAEGGTDRRLRSLTVDVGRGRFEIVKEPHVDLRVL